MCSSSDAEDTKIQSSKNGRSWLNEKAEISEENLVRSDELPPRKEPAGPAGRDVLRWRQQPPPGAIHGTTGFCRACKNGWLGFEVIRGKILLPSQRALETVCLTHTGKPIILKPRTVLVLLFLGGITVCDSRGSKVTSLGYYLQGCVHTGSSAQITLVLDACSSTSITTVNLCCDLKPSTERDAQPEAQLKHFHNKIRLSQNL